MKIQESAENYLEMILMLQQRKGYARSVDVAAELGVSKPSVSFAMKNFRENGFVTMDDAGHIELTDSGRIIAERMYERHSMLYNFLVALGVDEPTAYSDACKIEHDISDASFKAICAHVRGISEKEHIQ